MPIVMLFGLGCFLLLVGHSFGNQRAFRYGLGCLGGGVGLALIGWWMRHRGWWD